MAVTRSPAYPGMALTQAVELIGKVYSQNRSNPVDREAAAKDMGFAGVTGSSSKALADLSHYGLIEKVGKGQIRVSQRAVDILYPASPSGKAAALTAAAFAPELFGQLRTQFPDGAPSENNLRSHLMRMGFATSAIPLVLNSYRDTHRIAQEPAVSESYSSAADDSHNGQTSAAKMEPAMPTMHTGTETQVPLSVVESVLATPLNKINMNIKSDVVHLSAVLDYRGLSLLEKKIASLKELMSPDDDTEDDS